MLNLSLCLHIAESRSESNEEGEQSQALKIEIISGAMGDHMWTARLDTEEQKDEFIDFVQATWQ